MTPGGIGTFDEFFEIITLKQLSRHTKAIAVFNVNGYYDDMERLLNKVVEENFAQKDTLELAKFFTDSESRLDYLETYQPPEIIISNMKHL